MSNKNSLKVHLDQNTFVDFMNNSSSFIKHVELRDNNQLSIRFIKKLSVRNVMLLKIYANKRSLINLLDERTVKSKYIFKHNLALNVYQMLYKTSLDKANKHSTLLIEFIIKPSEIKQFGSVSAYRKLSTNEKLKYLYKQTATDEIFIDLSSLKLQNDVSYGISIECFDFELQLQYISEINKFIELSSNIQDNIKRFSIKDYADVTASELGISSSSIFESSVSCNADVVSDTTCVDSSEIASDTTITENMNVSTETVEEIQSNETTMSVNKISDETPNKKDMGMDKKAEEPKKEEITKKEEDTKEHNKITLKECNYIANETFTQKCQRAAHQNFNDQRQRNVIVELSNKVKQIPQRNEISSPITIKQEFKNKPESTELGRVFKKMNREQTINEVKAEESEKQPKSKIQYKVPTIPGRFGGRNYRWKSQTSLCRRIYENIKEFISNVMQLTAAIFFISYLFSGTVRHKVDKIFDYCVDNTIDYIRNNGILKENGQRIKECEMRNKIIVDELKQEINNIKIEKDIKIRNKEMELETLKGREQRMLVENEENRRKMEMMKELERKLEESKRIEKEKKVLEEKLQREKEEKQILMEKQENQMKSQSITYSFTIDLLLVIMLIYAMIRQLTRDLSKIRTRESIGYYDITTESINK